MKQKMTTKALRSLASSLNATVYSVGYAELQYLFNYKTPQAYTAGVYGWNYDCYWLLDSNNKHVFINTGYRGTFGKPIDWEIVEEYDKKSQRNLS